MNANDMIDKIIDFLCRAKRKTYAGKGKEISITETKKFTNVYSTAVR